MAFTGKKDGIKLTNQLIAKVGESLKVNPPFVDKIEHAKSQLEKHPVPKNI